jgi:DNA-binding NtrC family response regulator
MVGFSTLEAGNGQEAFSVAARSPGRIDLLVSDIDLKCPPDGIRLAEMLTRLRPHMKVLLMSGSRHEHVVWRHGWQFILKPFKSSDIVAAIAGTLARPLD